MLHLEASDAAAGNTPLMLAAKNGHTNCCRLLIDLGANVHAHNRYNQTAIDLAASAEHLGTVAALKQEGAVDFPVL